MPKQFRKRCVAPSGTPPRARLEHGNTHCIDEACCNSICTIDSYCCNTQWDYLCAYSASLYCFACSPCPADLNFDGQVNATDITSVLSSWGTANEPADVNDDGIVNALDVAAVLSAWGPC